MEDIGSSGLAAGKKGPEGRDRIKCSATGRVPLAHARNVHGGEVLGRR